MNSAPLDSAVSDTPIADALFKEIGEPQEGRSWESNVAYAFRELERRLYRDTAMTVSKDLLDEIEDYLESNLDVVDGSYGEPSPNRAMQLYTALQEARRWPTCKCGRIVTWCKHPSMPPCLEGG